MNNQESSSSTRLRRQKSSATLMDDTETTTSIVWFRKGLRVHDNPALSDALIEAKNGLKDERKKVLPLFIMDPLFCNAQKVGANRMNFLLQSLTNLNDNLRSLSSIDNAKSNDCLLPV